MREVSTSNVSTAATFTEALNRYQGAIYAFLRGFTHDGEHARDLTQDVFYDAWRATQRAAPPFVTLGEAGGWGDEDGVRRWLFHTAYCRAVSALRRRRYILWESLDADDALTALTGESAPFEERVAEAQALQRALAELAPESVATLLLSVVHGFTTAEIAEIVGASHEATKKRLARAKQLLRTVYLAQNPTSQE